MLFNFKAHKVTTFFSNEQIIGKEKCFFNHLSIKQRKCPTFAGHLPSISILYYWSKNDWPFWITIPL